MSGETPTVESALLSMLKEDNKVIAYRPRISRMVGTTSAILLQQMYFRYDGAPFYKLKAPCSSRLYKTSDSWCEELGFHSGEFDTALRRISTKCVKGKSKTELLEICPDIPQPIAAETKKKYMARLGVALKYLIIFWTDSQHVTWYSLNLKLFAKLLIAIYIDKLDCAIHGLNGESQFIFIAEKKKTTKKKSLSSPKNGDDGEPIHNCFGCVNDMFAGEDAYWQRGIPEELYCHTCKSYDDSANVFEKKTLQVDNDNHIAPEICGECGKFEHMTADGECEYCGWKWDSKCGGDIIGNCGDHHNGTCPDYDGKVNGCKDCDCARQQAYRAANDAFDKSIKDDPPIVSIELGNDGRLTEESWNRIEDSAVDLDKTYRLIEGAIYTCDECSVNIFSANGWALGDKMYCPDCHTKKTFVTAGLADTPQMTVEELDDKILGTRDKPVTATEHIGALCEVESYATITADKDIAPKTMEALGAMIVAADKAVKDGTLPKAKKVKRTPEQKQVDNNMFEAVAHVWKTDSAWKIQKFKKFLLGKIGSSKADKRYGHDFKNCQLNDPDGGLHPADAQEVIAFGHWWRSTYDDMTIPEKGNVLLNYFQSFRGSAKWESFMRKAEGTIADKIPNIKLPGAVEKPPEVEEEYIEMTPERIKQMADAMDKIGRGGVK